MSRYIGAALLLRGVPGSAVHRAFTGRRRYATFEVA